MNKKAVLWPTTKGEVAIWSHCTAEEVRAYTFDSQFGSHAHYKSLYTRRESLEDIAANPDANVTLALSGGIEIIGFGVLAYPEAGERWAALGDRLMMEVKAIEVGRSWRTAGVAKGLLQRMLFHSDIENKIVYMVGYAWTWDLDGTGMSAQQYRNMLIDLFEPFGFREFQTNEPNLCLKAENMFLGRIGKTVSAKHRDEFKWLRFGIYPDKSEF